MEEKEEKEEEKFANLPHWLPSSSDYTTVLVINVSIMMRYENLSSIK